LISDYEKIRFWVCQKSIFEAKKSIKTKKIERSGCHIILKGALDFPALRNFAAFFTGSEMYGPVKSINSDFWDRKSKKVSLRMFFFSN